MSEQTQERKFANAAEAKAYKEQLKAELRAMGEVIAEFTGGFVAAAYKPEENAVYLKLKLGDEVTFTRDEKGNVTAIYLAQGIAAVGFDLPAGAMNGAITKPTKAYLRSGRHSSYVALDAKTSLGSVKH